MQEIFEERTVEGFPLLALKGKIMGGPRTRKLCERIQEIVAAGAKHVILDFSNVRWINSTGIGELLNSVNRIRKQGGEVYFTALQERLAEYFELIKLNTVFKLYENQEQVLKALARG